MFNTKKNDDVIVQEVSQEAFESFFGEAGSGTPLGPSAEGMLGSGQQDAADNPNTPATPAPQTPAAQQAQGDMPQFNLDDLNKQPGEENAATPQQPGAAAQEEDDEEEEEESQTTPEHSAVYKNMVDYYISKGLWVDFEGREEREGYTDEEFAELAEMQDSFRFNKRIEEGGDYAKAIMDFISNGGNPDQLIDIFKQKQEVKELDISTVEGQKQAITVYYQNFVGWKPEKIRKQIEAWEADNLLESEARESKEVVDQKLAEQAKAIEDQNLAYQRQRQEDERKFDETIITAVNSRDDLTAQQKKLIGDRMTIRNQQLPNGHKVSQMYIDFLKAQSNPDHYVKLAEFLQDIDKYDKKVVTKKNNKTAEAKFNFLKGSNKAKGDSTIIPRAERSNKKESGFSFR